MEVMHGKINASCVLGMVFSGIGFFTSLIILAWSISTGFGVYDKHLQEKGRSQKIDGTPFNRKVETIEATAQMEVNLPILESSRPK